VQVGGEVAVPGAVCSVPASQAGCCKHCDWFAVDEYVPSAHGVH